MKPIKIFSLLILIIPFYLTAQNQNIIVDDVYYNPSDQVAMQANKLSDKQQKSNVSKPNYKNGAKEIVFKERHIKYPTIIRDTVFVDGKSLDGFAIHTSNFDINSYDGRTNPVYLHDTIYSEGSADIENKSNEETGYYLNGFNGSESDKEYAERIRHFHNPRYSVFIGDPRYNDIYFLNSNDWNVYIDDSYAYITPTWTNPYWWNYNMNPYGFGGWGHGWNSPYYGFGGMYNPWYGYDSFYGYGGMYGYGNYWDLYGYAGYYGYGSGGYYGGLFGNIKKSYNENTRHPSSNYSTDNSGRLGGTRSATGSSSPTVNSGGLISSRNQYTMVSGSGANNGTITRTSSNSGTRFVSNPSSGIGVVRNNTNRGISYSNYNSTTRSSTTSGMNINTSPRTYTATSNSIPTSGNYTTRDNNSSNTVSSFRNTSPTITRSSTSTTTAPSRGNYSSGISPSSVSRSTPTYSTPSSSSYSSGNSSSYNSGNSGSNSGGGSRSSSSGGGRR